MKNSTRSLLPDEQFEVILLITTRNLVFRRLFLFPLVCLSVCLFLFMFSRVYLYICLTTDFPALHFIEESRQRCQRLECFPEQDEKSYERKIVGNQMQERTYMESNELSRNMLQTLCGLVPRTFNPASKPSTLPTMAGDSYLSPS